MTDTRKRKSARMSATSDFSNYWPLPPEAYRCQTNSQWVPRLDLYEQMRPFLLEVNQDFVFVSA